MFKTLTPLFALIIAIGLGFTYVKPTFIEIQSLQNQEKEYVDALNKANQLKQEIDKKKKQMGDFSPVVVDRLTTMVPDSMDRIATVINLDALAASHTLSFSDISIEESVKKQEQTAGRDAAAQTPTSGGADQPAFVSHEIGFSVTGTYEDFRAYLESLEKSLQFFEITKLDFNAPTGDLFSFNLSVQTYTFNPEK